MNITIISMYGGLSKLSLGINLRFRCNISIALWMAMNYGHNYGWNLLQRIKIEWEMRMEKNEGDSSSLD